MSAGKGNEDLRRIKTRKALYAALSSCLGAHYFGKITVTDICEEAQVSRATFYTYFLDKYDLLKYWLVDLWSKNASGNGSYEQIEKVANYCIHENKSILNHLIYRADDETMDILFEFLLSTLDLTIDKNDSGEEYPKKVVLSNFYAGGILFYLGWQIKNRFPENIQPMNIHFYDIMNKFQEWKSEEKKL